jgi:hypothetical protein
MPLNTHLEMGIPVLADILGQPAFIKRVQDGTIFLLLFRMESPNLQLEEPRVPFPPFSALTIPHTRISRDTLSLAIQHKFSSLFPSDFPNSELVSWDPLRSKPPVLSRGGSRLLV